jgi:hypothetical protein
MRVYAWQGVPIQKKMVVQYLSLKQKIALRKNLTNKRPHFITIEDLKEIGWTLPEGATEQKAMQSILQSINGSKTHFNGIRAENQNGILKLRYGDDEPFLKKDVTLKGLHERVSFLERTYNCQPRDVVNEVSLMDIGERIDHLEKRISSNWEELSKDSHDGILKLASINAAQAVLDQIRG